MSIKNNEISIIPKEVFINKIYFLRNEKIMLDKDLALLYGVKLIRLREQVKRNISIFPSHFMFQLKDLEVEIMVSQNAIPSKKPSAGQIYEDTIRKLLKIQKIMGPIS